MPSPTDSDLHVNKLLSDLSVAYMNEQSAFIARKVFPVVPVSKRSDRYAVYDDAAFLRSRAAARAPATESIGGGYKVDTTPTYYCEKYSYHRDIPDEERDNADPVFNPEVDSMEHVTHAILLKMEELWVTNYFTTGKWGTDRTGVASGPTGDQFVKWNVSTATPIDDIRLSSNNVLAKTGRRPNVLVINPKVLAALEDHSSIVDRIKYTSDRTVTPEVLARLFRLDEVLIAESVIDSSVDGAAASTGFVIGNHALLVYRPQRAGRKIPAGGYTFVWKDTDFDVMIKQFRMEEFEADRIEGNIYFDMKLVASKVGVFFSTAI